MSLWHIIYYICFNGILVNKLITMKNQYVDITKQTQSPHHKGQYNYSMLKQNSHLMNTTPENLHMLH